MASAGKPPGFATLATNTRAFAFLPNMQPHRFSNKAVEAMCSATIALRPNANPWKSVGETLQPDMWQEGNSGARRCREATLR